MVLQYIRVSNKHTLNLHSVCANYIFLKKYLFLIFWLHWAFVVALGLL